VDTRPASARVRAERAGGDAPGAGRAGDAGRARRPEVGVRVDRDALRALRTDEGRAVLGEVAARGVSPDTLLATVTDLRRRHPAPLVSAAVGQVRLRERALAKFGPDAARMFFTPDGLEQATRAGVAAHRAARYVRAGAGRVLDLGCGVGGDLLALARAGLTVHGVDRDPLTVEVARANAEELGLADRVRVCQGDAEQVPLAGWPAAFCDPARRAGGRRVFDPAAYSPPFDFLLRLAAEVPLTAAKVAPGIPHELVPAGAEAEWVSDAGEVKEAVLWWGDLATARRRATLLPAGDTLTGTGAPDPPVAPPGRWLYEPDGAVVRAHLVAEVAETVGGWLLDPTIAYVSGDRLVRTPFARAYAVTDVLPFSLKSLRALLASRGVGAVTVKKRGSAVDPDELRQRLRLRGDAHGTVVLTRMAGAPTALLCEPVSAGEPPERGSAQGQ
jgi:SAM-dependent methyltransferase